MYTNEIKLKILLIAKDLLLEEYYNDWETARQNWEFRRDLCLHHLANDTDMSEPVDDLVKPEPPTTADIITKAKNLYYFIEGK